mmetsp:Transcript_15580/g.28645  ORF Transcript_15580/g.28645 Transcript_15580/m.28645 type:complete len:280 (-) Transcript_15580:54-893(-)
MFIALPGLLCVVCGFFGCANARQFTFLFDRSMGDFVASAGNSQLTQPIHRICLIYIERECDHGGLFGGGAPSFSAVLLLVDGMRIRLEGGVSMTGTGLGPDHLHEQAEKIRCFLDLSQTNIPVLEMTKEAEPTETSDQRQANQRLHRWLSCAGIEPRLEPPLHQYNWLDSGPIGCTLPPPAFRISRGHSAILAVRGPVARVQAPVRGLVPSQYPSHVGGTAVVMGRPAGSTAPAPRYLDFVVPEGSMGQNITVRTPDGTHLALTVPADARPGQSLKLQY